MSNLLTTEHPLVVLPTLASRIGLNEAIVLQQIHYWLSKGEDNGYGKVISGIRWIYNRLDDWLEQFTWLSKWQLRQVLHKLRHEFKLVKFAQHEKQQWCRRGWYTIDYEQLEAMHTSMCGDANLQESVEQTFDVQTAHISDSETSSKISSKTTTSHVAVCEILSELEKVALVQMVAEGPPEESIEEIQATIADAPLMRNDNQDLEPVDKSSAHSRSPYTEPQFCNSPNVALQLTSKAAAEESFEEDEERPTPEQLREVRRELKAIDTRDAPRINPDDCMGIIVREWRNVAGAIAYVKEAIRTWSQVKSPIAVFIKACQQGLRSEVPDRYGGIDRQQRWDAAGLHFGKERRNQLIQSVVEYAGEVWVSFTNGKQISLAEAQKMNWEEIAGSPDFRV